MKRTIGIMIVAVMAVVLVSIGASQAQTPVGTSFTYQGRLFDSGGHPINDSLCLGARLFDSDVAVDPIAAMSPISTTLSDGYFTLATDFGSQWNGDERWLEITQHEWSGACGTMIDHYGRQQIYAVPYALHSLDATVTPQPTATPMDTATPQPTATPMATAGPMVYQTPESISVSTMNSGSTTTHTHAIVSSNNPGAAASVLASNSNGGLQLERLGIGVADSSSYSVRIDRASNGGYDAALYAYLNVSSATTGVPSSLKFQAESYVSSDMAGLYAIQGNVYMFDGGGVIGNVIGVRPNLWQFGDKTIYEMTGFQPWVRSVSGNGIVYIGSALKSQFRTDSGAPKISEIRHIWLTNPQFLGTAADAQYGLYIEGLSGASVNYALYGGSGTYHLGDNVEVAGNVNPTISGTYNLGSSALAWHQVNANQFVTHSYVDLSDGVKLRDGRVVSCTIAIAALKRGKDTTISGLPHMDYEASDFPAAAYVSAQDEWQTHVFTSSAPVAGAMSSTPITDENGKIKFYNVVTRELLKGQTGADMDVMQSIFMCAQREMDVKSKALDVTLADMNKRLKALEAGKP